MLVYQRVTSVGQSRKRAFVPPAHGERALSMRALLVALVEGTTVR